MDPRQMSVSTLIRETGLTCDEVPLQFVGHNDDSGQKGVARAVVSMRRMVHARKTAQAHSIAVSLKQNGVTPPCMHRIVQITFLSKGYAGHNISIAITRVLCYIYKLPVHGQSSYHRAIAHGAQ